MGLSRAAKADLWFVVVTLLAAAGWIFSKEAILLMPPLLFISLRFLLAGMVLTMVGFRQVKALSWNQYRQSIFVGAIFSFGTCFWVMGLYSGVSISVGVFLTSLAVIMVPLLSRVLFKEKPPRSTWFSIPVAVIGLAILTLKSDLSIETGQLFFLAASFFFGIFFIYNTRAANHQEVAMLDESINVSEKVPALPLTAITLLVVGVIAAAVSLYMEPWQPTFTDFSLELLFWVSASALVGTALRFFIQTHAQSLSTHSHGVVIMVVEPIWTACLAAAWFDESLSQTDLMGCSLIFLSIVINRWPLISGLFRFLNKTTT